MTSSPIILYGSSNPPGPHFTSLDIFNPSKVGPVSGIISANNFLLRLHISYAESSKLVTLNLVHTAGFHPLHNWSVWKNEKQDSLTMVTWVPQTISFLTLHSIQHRASADLLHLSWSWVLSSIPFYHEPVWHSSCSVELVLQSVFRPPKFFVPMWVPEEGLPGYIIMLWQSISTSSFWFEWHSNLPNLPSHKHGCYIPCPKLVIILGVSSGFILASVPVAATLWVWLHLVISIVHVCCVSPLWLTCKTGWIAEVSVTRRVLRE